VGHATLLVHIGQAQPVVADVRLAERVPALEHMPVKQPIAECAARHDIPQTWQLSMSVVVSVSHPFAGSPSQSARPGEHSRTAAIVGGGDEGRGAERAAHAAEAMTTEAVIRKVNGHDIEMMHADMGLELGSGRAYARYRRARVGLARPGTLGGCEVDLGNSSLGTARRATGRP
jgi:hypothetical protein